MPSKLDPAILAALSLDQTTTTLTSHGSSGFSSTFKLTGTGSDGKETLYFVKTGRGGESAIMFAGEHASLNAIHAIDPTLCPQSFAHGPLSSSPGSFLATSFLDLSPSASTKSGSGVPLSTKLAKLHSSPGPILDEYNKPMFGFPVPTCCGETQQENGWRESWAEFYGENRLTWILKQAEAKQGKDSELRSLMERIVVEVVPRLLGDGHVTAPDGGPIQPVIVHGDLWSGNKGRGVLSDDGGVEEVVFDPSACYAHSEFEFGIMGMFGGFGAAFNKAYWEVKPEDEPVGEWEDRRQLYELYHHLNHYTMFGGGYRGGAASIMQGLIKKYGEKS